MINYADDTTLMSTLNAFTPSSDHLPPTGTQGINSELEKVHNWLCCNKSCLNINKTKFMVFHPPQKDVDYPTLSINNVQIDCVDNFTFLGITINEHLSWRPHMTKILNKVSKTGYILNKLKKILPEGILLTIYNSLINPHFNYAILLWGHKGERIFKQQKKVIRHITRSKFNAHTDPLFIKLRVLKIEDLRKLSELKFYHKFTHSQLPEYFLNDFLTHNRDLHDHFTRNQSHLVTPAYPHQFARYILRVSIVETVNNFPDIILSKIQTHSLQAIGANAKEYFLSKYAAQCNIPNCYACQS